MRSSFCLSIAGLFVLFGCAPPEGSDAVVTGRGVALSSPTVELIKDGSFEQALSTDYWAEGLEATIWANLDSHSGTHEARVTSVTGDLSQQITIPSDAASADLTFWAAKSHWFHDECQLKFWVRTPTNNQAWPHAIPFSAFNEPFTYVKKGPFNLLEFRGQTINLVFDGSCVQYASVDDVSVQVTYSDFSLSTAAASQALYRPTFEITATAAAQGASQNVALSVSGLPAAATASFSPASISTDSSSILTVNVGSAAPGTYTLLVKGVGDVFGTQETTLTLPLAPLVTNGGFEAGTLAGWTATGNVLPAIWGSHAGTYYGRIGKADAPTGLHTLSQSFSVPATGTTTLNFWAYFHASAPQDGDYQRARLRTSSGQLLDTIFKKLGNNTQTWTQYSVDLTPYQGTDVVLQFEVQATQVGVSATYMRVDDVSITNL